MQPSKQCFLAQCKRRFGRTNPERLQIEHWEWMVREGCSAYEARKAHGLEHRFDGPDWCFERYGMSRTSMSDGSIICIAGEHEDYYDPDFCIYNDMIVLRPETDHTAVSHHSGRVEIYAYPEADFPPTDFHSATLVGDRIYVIGNLGYQGTRRPGETPVYALCTRTYAIEEVTTVGTPPGWIYKHHAAYDPDSHSIAVRAGRIMRSTEPPDELAYFGAHRLHLDDNRWELISPHERHRRYRLFPVGKNVSCCPEPSPQCFYPKAVPHTVLQPLQKIDPDIAAVSVMGVRIRYEAAAYVHMEVEGELPDDVLNTMLEEILGNLFAETDFAWSSKELSTQ